MNKTKQFLLIALLAMAGLATKVHAYGSVTFTSTATFISSGTDIEIMSVLIGTGNATSNDVYAILVDSDDSQAGSYGGAGVLISSNGFDFSPAKYPPSTWITPPLMAASTATVTGVPGTPNTARFDFLTATGEGYTVRKTLTVYIVKNSGIGSANATPVTINYRKRRDNTER